jgi:hypothetical protein
MLKALEHPPKLYSVNLYVSRVHTKFLIIFLAYGSSATTHTMPCRSTVHEDPVKEKVVVLGHWLFKLPPPLFFISPFTISRMYLKVDLGHFVALRKFHMQ